MVLGGIIFMEEKKFIMPSYTKEQRTTNEQWNGAGDCRICRRAKYCGHSCKPFRDNVKAAYNELVKEEEDNEQND